MTREQHINRLNKICMYPTPFQKTATFPLPLANVPLKMCLLAKWHWNCFYKFLYASPCITQSPFFIQGTACRALLMQSVLYDNDSFFTKRHSSIQTNILLPKLLRCTITLQDFIAEHKLQSSPPHECILFTYIHLPALTLRVTRTSCFKDLRDAMQLHDEDRK